MIKVELISCVCGVNVSDYSCVNDQTGRRDEKLHDPISIISSQALEEVGLEHGNIEVFDRRSGVRNISCSQLCDKEVCQHRIRMQHVVVIASVGCAEAFKYMTWLEL